MQLTLRLETDALRFEIEVDYIPAVPGRHTLSNGDPGYPDDPAEVYLDTYEAWLHTDLLKPLPPNCDEGRIPPCDWLAEMVQAWVNSPDGLEAAMEAFRDRQEADAELRHEARMERLRDRD